MTPERITVTYNRVTATLRTLTACIVFTDFCDRDADITKREVNPISYFAV